MRLRLFVLFCLAAAVAAFLIGLSAGKAKAASSFCSQTKYQQTLVVITCRGEWSQPYALRVKSRLGWNRLSWEFGCDQVIMSDDLSGLSTALAGGVGARKRFSKAFTAENTAGVPMVCTLRVSVKKKPETGLSWSIQPR